MAVSSGGVTTRFLCRVQNERGRDCVLFAALRLNAASVSCPLPHCDKTRQTDPTVVKR